MDAKGEQGSAAQVQTRCGAPLDTSLLASSGPSVATAVPARRPASMPKGLGAAGAQAAAGPGTKPGAPSAGAASTSIPPASTSSSGPLTSHGARASTSSAGASPARLLSATAGAMQQQRSDRLVAFLATLVTYPFMFLLTKRAAAIGISQLSAVGGGGGIDTRKRLADFPEGAALLGLER